MTYSEKTVTLIRPFLVSEIKKKFSVNLFEINQW